MFGKYYHKNSDSPNNSPLPVKIAKQSPKLIKSSNVHPKTSPLKYDED
jgi:hypothetical protein